MIHYDVEHVPANQGARIHEGCERIMLHVRREQVLALVARLARSAPDMPDLVSVAIDVALPDLSEVAIGAALPESDE